MVKPRFSKEICEPALSLSVKCLHSCDPQMPQKRLRHFFGYYYLGKVLSKKKKRKTAPKSYMFLKDYRVRLFLFHKLCSGEEHKVPHSCLKRGVPGIERKTGFSVRSTAHILQSAWLITFLECSGR